MNLLFTCFIRRLPKFLLGPHTGVVKGYCPPNAKLECRDSSPEKSNLNITEEQSSSLSEQAWDNYQVGKRLFISQKNQKY